MEKWNIIGVSLTDRSSKEALIQADEFISSGAVNTVLFLTTPMLIAAGKDQAQKDWIEAADMTLCADADILRAAGVTSRSRIHEVENQVFLRELLRRLARGRKPLYLIASSKESLDILEKGLNSLQEGFPVAGRTYLGDEQEETESLVNDINDLVPAVVISRLPFGRQMEFMENCKPYVNTEIWIGLPEGMNLGPAREALGTRLRKRFYNKLFKRKVNRYEQEKAE